MLNTPVIAPLGSELSGPDAVNVPLTGTASEPCPWGFPASGFCENIMLVLNSNIANIANRLRFCI
jgi:hypothetical protein